MGVGMRAIKMFVAALAIVIRPDKPTRVSPTRNNTWEGISRRANRPSLDCHAVDLVLWSISSRTYSMRPFRLPMAARAGRRSAAAVS